MIDDKLKAEIAAKLHSFLSDLVNEPPYHVEWVPAVKRFCRYIPSTWVDIVQKFWGKPCYELFEQEFNSGKYTSLTQPFFDLEDKSQAEKDPTRYVYVRTHAGQDYAGLCLSLEYVSLAQNMGTRRFNTGLAHAEPGFKVMVGLAKLGLLEQDELISLANQRLKQIFSNSEIELRLIPPLSKENKK